MKNNGNNKGKGKHLVGVRVSSKGARVRDHLAVKCYFNTEGR